jgi:hypothetical protein
MVPALDISDFALADTGNLAGPTPDCLMACVPLTAWPLSTVMVLRHDFKRRRRVNAAIPQGQRRGFRGGE